MLHKNAMSLGERKEGIEIFFLNKKKNPDKKDVLLS